MGSNTAVVKAKTKKRSKREASPAGVGNLKAVADWGVQDKLFSAHRGWFVEDGRLIVFDNGGVGHPWGVHELELTPVWLRDHGFVVEGMATCSECHTWVVVANAGRDADTDGINDMLWEAWSEVCGVGDDPHYDLYKSCQLQEALATILGRPRMPQQVRNQLSRPAK